MDCGDDDVGHAGVVCNEGKKGDWGTIVWAMVGLVVDDDFGALGEGEEVGHFFGLLDMSCVMVATKEATIAAPLSSLDRGI